MIGLGMGVRVVVPAHSRLGGGSEGGGACTLGYNDFYNLFMQTL